MALLRHLLFLSFGGGLLAGSWSVGAPGALPAAVLFFGSYAIVSALYAATSTRRSRDLRA